MTIPQLGDDTDAVETCVLGERCRDDLEGLGESLPADRLGADEGLGFAIEGARDLDFGSTTTGDKSPR